MSRQIELRLAELLRRGSGLPNINIVRSLKDATWIFFEYDAETKLWTVLPAGLAVIAAFPTPESAFDTYKQAVPRCGWSYEEAASLLTRVSRKLLVDANKAYVQYSLEEIISRLTEGIPLVRQPVGPRIIDPISDPGK